MPQLGAYGFGWLRSAGWHYARVDADPSRAYAPLGGFLFKAADEELDQFTGRRILALHLSADKGDLTIGPNVCGKREERPSFDNCCCAKKSNGFNNASRSG
jgi:hypothetical protein